MSKTVVIRYETKPEAADENQRLVEQVFAELKTTSPDGLRYATFRLEDGVSFVHVATIDGPDNPLANVAAFAEFQREIGDRLIGPPTAMDAKMIGNYGFSG
ncbi:MAG: hypothetical protein ABIR57_11475 [Aeromicrobium sp.]